MNSCSCGAELPIFLGIFEAVAGNLCLPRHFVGYRLINDTFKFYIYPDPAVNRWVAFKAVQSPQVFLRNDVKNALQFGFFLEVDIGVEPLHNPRGSWD